MEIAIEKPTDFLRHELTQLREIGLYRSCRLIEGEQLPVVRVNGKHTIMLCSNNYLGLATHPALKQAAAKAIEEYGCGAGASRLISGTMELHEQLEQVIARFKCTEAALVFNSGYMANLGVISALVSQGDIIFSDELNHASIVDGCRLSKATTRVYAHKDVSALEAMLASSVARRRLIVTDGIFSMDGDIAPLPDIVAVARRYGAMVMVDDAHATGVLGKNGRGTASHFGVEAHVDIHLGTLSKAFGGFGAYVAGSSHLREFLINKARSLIFSTALPPPVVATAMAAFDLVERDHWRRKALFANAEYLRDGLSQMGFDCAHSETNIIPVMVGDAARTVRLSQSLLREGVFAHAIRPPTVPQGGSRLRVTVMATHEREHLERALDAFGIAGRDVGLIG